MLHPAVGTPFSRAEQAFLIQLGRRFSPMPAAQPGEWLAQKIEVPQSFNTFRQFNLVTSQCNTIYILPLSLTLAASLLNRLQLFCEAFYLGMKVVILDPLDFDRLQQEHKFTSRISQDKQQFLTKDILNFMKGCIPSDAYAVMGIFDRDLYPYEDETFVFGWAMYTAKVGIFSVLRWDPDAFQLDNGAMVDPDLVLYPAARTMIHEIGHMFGLSHCVYYRCHMSGFHSITENYKAPLEFCPVCFRKFIGNLAFEPAQRYLRLIEASIQLNFDRQIILYTQLHKSASPEEPGVQWWPALHQHLTRVKRNPAKSKAYSQQRYRQDSNQRDSSTRSINNKRSVERVKEGSDKDKGRLPPLLPNRKAVAVIRHKMAPPRPRSVRASSSSSRSIRS